MQWTDNDFAAFRNGVCVAIQTIMVGKGSERNNRQFYTENAGLEIKILPRTEAVAALRAALPQPSKTLFD
jgi:type II secretory pathway component GspD/PulD (secretin)